MAKSRKKGSDNGNTVSAYGSYRARTKVGKLRLRDRIKREQFICEAVDAVLDRFQPDFDPELDEDEERPIPSKLDPELGSLTPEESNTLLTGLSYIKKLQEEMQARDAGVAPTQTIYLKKSQKISVYDGAGYKNRDEVQGNVLVVTEDEALVSWKRSAGRWTKTTTSYYAVVPRGVEVDAWLSLEPDSRGRETFSFTAYVDTDSDDTFTAETLSDEWVDRLTKRSQDAVRRARKES